MSVQALIDQEAKSVQEGNKYNLERCAEIGRILINEKILEWNKAIVS